MDDYKKLNDVWDRYTNFFTIQYISDENKYFLGS